MSESNHFVDARGVKVIVPNLLVALSNLADLAEQNLPDDMDVAFGDDGVDDMGVRQVQAIGMLRGAVESHGDALEALLCPGTSYEAELPDGEPGTLSGAILDCASSARAMHLDPMTVSGIDEAEEFDRVSALLDFVEAVAISSGPQLDALNSLAKAPGQ